MTKWTSFRQCPLCGRRFHVVLVEKKLVKVVHKETVRTPPRMLKTAPLGRVWPVGEGELVTIDTQVIRYSFRCKHCGHEWSEERTEKHVEKPTASYD